MSGILIRQEIEDIEDMEEVILEIEEVILEINIEVKAIRTNEELDQNKI